MVGAIVAAVATIASTAVNIGMAVKASKEAEKLNKKTSAGEQSALALQRMKTADLAGQGGMTAGQYSRALMQDDAYAMQVQGLTNKIESQSVFGDSFRKEAFYRLALSDIKSFTQKTASNLQDMDANMIVQNAQLSLQASSNLREAEGALVDRENAIKAKEIEMKSKIMENVAKGIASTAQLVGAGMKYYNAKSPATTTTAKSPATTTTPVETASPEVYNGESSIFNKTPMQFETTTGITPKATGGWNPASNSFVAFDYSGIHALEDNALEANKYPEYYDIGIDW
ncbi:MAG: hypothetical protein BWY74_03787 [Firmicutes bacterium ADurb.Bin419]|nr:MAG: hypothetical protein BWY74_03787 [Firmicutes bacterium ADurb.Bin419]